MALGWALDRGLHSLAELPGGRAKLRGTETRSSHGTCGRLAVDVLMRAEQKSVLTERSLYTQYPGRGLEEGGQEAAGATPSSQQPFLILPLEPSHKASTVAVWNLWARNRRNNLTLLLA